MGFEGCTIYNLIFSSINFTGYGPEKLDFKTFFYYQCWEMEP